MDLYKFPLGVSKTSAQILKLQPLNDGSTCPAAPFNMNEAGHRRVWTPPKPPLRLRAEEGPGGTKGRLRPASSAPSLWLGDTVHPGAVLTFSKKLQSPVPPIISLAADRFSFGGLLEAKIPFL